MKYASLGRGGPEVSRVAIGTVALGVPYGAVRPGEEERPARQEAIELIREAVEAGVNLFDTAPAYGPAEEILGIALEDCDDVLVATKAPVPMDGSGKVLSGVSLRKSFQASIAGSLRALRRHQLDLLQLHNPTVEVLDGGEVGAALESMREEGMLRLVGASVYSEDEAMASLKSGMFDVIQVPYSVLDQRMADRVLPLARRLGVGVLVRSALLKGALTPRSQVFPPALEVVSVAADRVRRELGVTWEDLPRMAERFVLSTAGVSSLLVGVRDSLELGEALKAIREGTVPSRTMVALADLALQEETHWNPSHWPLP